MLKFGNTYLNFGGTYLSGCKVFDPNNPLDLPQNTIRVRTNDGNAPIKDRLTTYETAKLVDGTTDTYDVYKSGTSFSNLFYLSTNVIEVLGANTTGITNMRYMFELCSALTNVPLFDTSSVTRMDGMFKDCISLTSIPLFDTSSVTDMESMFRSCGSLTSIPLFDTSSVTRMSGMFFNCISLTSIPLFDTSSVTDMSYMFYGCVNVESGALALYQQAISQANPPVYHDSTFNSCGENTITGSTELAQIPSDWK